MKKNLMIVAIAAVLSSCGVTIPTQEATIIPTAINTVNTASFSELNLDRKDYQILNTISAEAVITHTWNKDNSKHKLSEQNGEFFIEYVDTKMGMKTFFHGVARFGYLSNDYGKKDYSAESLARRFAIYRLINIAQENGADGIIEPTISTNVEQTDNRTIIYKTTVVAKIVKLKTDN